MSMWRALKVCFLYIGTIIGAGFASGREIALFFGETAPLNVALSAVFMAVLEMLFLVAGRVNALPDNTAIRTGVFIAAFSSVAAMLAGGDFALYSLTGVRSLGIITALLAGALVVGGIEKIKLANTLLIPLLIALLLAVYIRNGSPVFQGDFSFVKPLRYSGLDVLLGGIVISREGKKLNKKEILATCIMSALFIGAVLFVLQNIVLSDTLHSSMPVLAVAEKVGLKTAAGILIAVAIFTTLVSSLDVLTQYTQESFSRYALSHSDKASSERRFVRFARKAGAPENKNVAVFATLLFLYPVSFFGFDLIVDTLYPFVSLCGILTTGWTAFNLIMRSRDKHANTYACSSSHSAFCPCPAPSSAHSRAHSSTHVSSVVGADDTVAQTADKSVAAGGKFSVCAFRGRDRNRSRDVRGRDSHSHRRRNRLRDNRSRRHSRSRLRTPRRNTPLLRPRRG